MKRLLLFLLSLVAAVGLSAPVYAYADKGDDIGEERAQAAETDAEFLAALKAAGFSYSSPNQVISSAQVVCVMAARGRPGLDIIYDLKQANPGLSTDRAAEFAKIASETYCSQQLEKKK